MTRDGSRILVKGGPAEFWPQGAPEPKICSKLPENCMILKISRAEGGPARQAPLDPLVHPHQDEYHLEFCGVTQNRRSFLTHWGEYCLVRISKRQPFPDPWFSSVLACGICMAHTRRLRFSIFSGSVCPTHFFLQGAWGKLAKPSFCSESPCRMVFKLLHQQTAQASLAVARIESLKHSWVHSCLHPCMVIEYPVFVLIFSFLLSFLPSFLLSFFPFVSSWLSALPPWDEAGLWSIAGFLSVSSVSVHTRFELVPQLLHVPRLHLRGVQTYAFFVLVDCFIV